MSAVRLAPRRLGPALFCSLVLLLAWRSVAAEPPPVGLSGLQPGEDVMPFTSNVVTGPYRGMQHCFVCDAKLDQPCMVAFLRTPDAAAARFIGAFRNARLAHGPAPLAWFVILGEAGGAAEAALEDRVLDFATEHRLTRLNVTVLGDPEGPPGYRVSDEAVLTVHVFSRFKVRFNRVRARAGWSESTAEEAGREALELLEEVARAAHDGAGPAEIPGPPSGRAPAPIPALFASPAVEPAWSAPPRPVK